MHSHRRESSRNFRLKMEVRSQTKISYKIILSIIFFSYFQGVTCQNCGLPSVVKILENNRLTEVMQTGDFIASMQLENVKRISSAEQNPDHFAQIIFDSEASSLTLLIDTPLWKSGQEYSSYIDRTRESGVNLLVKFECSDGHIKTVKFEVPVVDENTAIPRFHIPDSNLMTEPCIAERCTLTLSTEITIIDEDRDKSNAEVNVWTDSPFVKAVPSFTSIMPWYDSAEFTPNSYSTPNGFQSHIKLEYLSDLTHNFTFTNPHNFTIFASNVADHYDKTRIEISKNVTISFVELDGRMVPPVFSSPFYYSYVMRYKTLKDMNPFNIRATVPDNISNSTVINYSIEGTAVDDLECAFKIDRITGVIKLNDYLRADVLTDLRNKFQTCYIIAERVNLRTQESIKAHATLITFFTEDFDQPYSPSSIPSTVKPEPTTQATTEMEELTTTEEPIQNECPCGCDDAFSCSHPSTYPSLNTTEFTVFQDLYQCTTYHKCDSFNDKSTFKCPEGTIFCPTSIISDCTSLEECLSATTMPCLAKEHENDGTCEIIQPGDPRNVCNNYNYSRHTIEDPEYCDIYHMCQPKGYMNEFFDIPKLCPVGQIFCPKAGVCGNHEHVDCDCPVGKLLKQCNVCIMGQWKHFNLFTKRFEKS